MLKGFTIIASVFVPFFCDSEKLRRLHSAGHRTSHDISFIENQGQVCDQFYSPRKDILFTGNSGDMTFYLKRNGISYQLYRYQSNESAQAGIADSGRKEIYRVDINWLSCSRRCNVEKKNVLPGYFNYFSETCPQGIYNVHHYEEVIYHDIYNGFNLRWKSENGYLKYEYLAKPGADYKQIAFEIEGSTALKINDKRQLVIKTPFGEIIEDAPLVNQSGKILKSSWEVSGNKVGFRIEGLKSDEEYIIDPAVRAWGTYYGDLGGDLAYCCTKDGTGNIYLSGCTDSGTAIATGGSHQSALGGLKDAFLAKFDSTGVLIWATYYGGAGQEIGYSCTTDQDLNVFMAGITASATAASVIATPGSHQPSNGGGPTDAFLVKFSTNGIRLWGTYYGDSDLDYGYTCKADLIGNVYMAGATDAYTGSLIATPGCHQSTISSGFDGFLVKFNAAGTRIWGTYYGGNGDDAILSCAIDQNDNVYLAGQTKSSSGTDIATVGSHQSAWGGGIGTFDDAFLVKLNSSGIRQWGTYYGGSSIDQGYSCATDNAGNVYLSGRTQSSTGTVIATMGSQQFLFGGSVDAFLVKFNTSGIRVWGTYYGDTGDELNSSCAADSYGNIYLEGQTSSSAGNIMTTAGSHQINYGGGASDAYLAKFDSNGVRIWGTYYGGAGSEITAWGCTTTDASGNVYITGETNSNAGTVIATPGSHQASYSGGYDVFLAKFYVCPPPSPVNMTPLGNQTLCAYNSATLNSLGTGTISWYSTPISTVVLGMGSVYITPTLSAGTYTYYADAYTCANSASRTAVTLTVSICTNLNEFTNSESQMHIYPNPTEDIFFIDCNGEAMDQLVVSDVLGRSVLAILKPKESDPIYIDTLPAGVYNVLVKSGEKRQFFRVIKY